MVEKSQPGLQDLLDALPELELKSDPYFATYEDCEIFVTSLDS